MSILITGATGFTGGYLLKKILTQGKKVNVLVRNKEKLGELVNNPNLSVFEGNIYEENLVNEAVSGVTKVFNVAAIFRTAGIPDQVYWDTHVKGTELLLKAALKAKVERFIHVSTVGVHGDVGTDKPANENAPFKPGDIYQVTKHEAEQYVHKFHKNTGLPISVIRPTAIYGPGDMRLLKLFKMVSAKITPIIGKGNIKYHMVYVEDLVKGILLASEKDEAIGEAFIIGGEKAFSLNTLLDLIGEVLGTSVKRIHLPVKPFQILGTITENICTPLKISPPIYRRRVDFFTKSRIFDISKAKSMLGYKPDVSLRDGLTKTAEWYVENNLI